MPHDESYFLKVLSALPGSVYWKNKEGIYIGANEASARMVGLHAVKDLLGKKDHDIFPKDQADQYRANDLKVMEEKREYSVEELSYSPNGQPFIQLSTKKPLLNDIGEVVGVVGSTLDITQLRTLEKELVAAKSAAESANQAKKEFLENMRHDIRTPLTGIVGFSEIVRSQVRDPKLQEELNYLVSSSHALLDFLNEVLEAVHVSSGDIPLLRSRFNLRDKMNQVIQLNQAKAREKNLKLELHCDPALPAYFIGDSVRIQRVILELVTNALNFTEQGSVTVTVRLIKQEGSYFIITIAVSDSGVGMTPEQQQEIFMRFKRLTPSYQGIYKGTGLGLSIVKQFVDELDGEVYVTSKLGEGATFTCVFRLKESLLDV